jgi:hypothetical protein
MRQHHHQPCDYLADAHDSTTTASSTQHCLADAHEQHEPQCDNWGEEWTRRELHESANQLERC